MKNDKPQFEHHKTNQYGLFETNEFQRRMKIDHIKKIRKTMCRWGFIPCCPIVVWWNPAIKKFEIIEGHHRFDAARLEGIEIYYMVLPVKSREEALELMQDLNDTVLKWGNKDTILQQVQLGNSDYQTLQHYVSLGIPSKTAASILIGESGHSGNAMVKVSKKQFKVKTTKIADQLVRYINQCRPFCSDAIKERYLQAVSIYLLLPEFDLDTLIKRIQNNPIAIQKASSVDQALSSLDEIYNFRSRDKVNLHLLAKEVLRNRNKVTPKKS